MLCLIVNDKSSPCDFLEYTKKAGGYFFSLIISVVKI